MNRYRLKYENFHIEQFVERMQIFENLFQIEPFRRNNRYFQKE